ncbi:helix-turn-helix domain-containing protein [Sinomonas sp. RB5]
MDRKQELISRTREQLIELAAHLASADNDLRWALIEARRAANISQHELAEMLGVKQSTISNFERHDNDPRLSTLRRYALAVGAKVCHQVQANGSTTTSDGWIHLEAQPMPPMDVTFAGMGTVGKQFSVEAARVSKFDYAPAA